MGYYVDITGWFQLKHDNLYDDECRAYKALCALNDDNSLKTGGTWPRDDSIVGAHPDRWFAWMPWDYPEHCSDLYAILLELGFEVTVTRGSVVDEYTLTYSDKWGAHDIFLEALAPYVLNGCIDVRGEQYELWRYEFARGRMFSRTSIHSWGDPVPTTYIATMHQLADRATRPA